MLRNYIPFFYYPTKVLLVDDNPNYLKNVVLTLDKCINHETHIHPKALLRKILSSNDVLDVGKKYFLSQDEGSVVGDVCRAVSVDIAKIYKEINNKDRFNQISVLLVDYAMPGMNGVEFCKALQHLPCKKIMVTGEADYGIAVEAFNQNIIDRFLVKDDPDFFEKINTIIFDLQNSYFKSLSESIIDTLSVDPHCCLTDPEFISFFYDLVKENKIIEFYLLDKTGSFLMLDFQGKPSWLIVKSNKELVDFCDIASEFEDANAIQNELAIRRKIPFFLTEKDWQVSVNHWQPYLHQAHRLEGKEIYYYALVEGNSVYDVALENKVSYRDYLSSKGLRCQITPEIHSILEK
ncbi:MAG: hypothetical protein A3I12_05820 [Gammaproteobacteria bacterium RIFCSPLOWO2_02_FULL_38_11]|nr:MAG: hypothetical protein A3B69_02295 [Gammaproteobacteria bacterium RIFCSPHIGHO2_02_FULL_38_33]OGT24468.1 MAG: hypothetical protein A2W47_03445 [Gammaproteobacteria bacterium RIFCSPHIGHO2_12_38_15]OGT69067.1 MAG: hypothetical protein A3I12_05820 [Gammaproteobacteria bacterium RIFCSPLOWO2_02_FULL_38_11]OGT77641.1 MAG: hypothetical protein A3G71_01980 [Gammaproteobacteria bacterium RIFCSPLOWO2_12_FULL_38_14]